MSVERLLTQCALLLAVFVCTGYGLSCYICHSAEPGCGKELSIRLERWHDCPDVAAGGGENFCVKLIEKRGSEEYITRGCLETFRRDTRHRQQIPTVQRHGYCEPARNNDPWNSEDPNTLYCFCNDWNGCNTATTHMRISVLQTLTVGLLLTLLLRYLS